MTAHDPKMLAAFQSGEERFVYARHKAEPDADLYYLEDGAAASVRAWAKENLECFIPDCPDRKITTVARTNGRDGFRHPAGAGRHSQESLFHEQGKALIARWVGDRYPAVTVVIEQATEDKSRRADVMLTGPDGRQIAVEVQYAALSVDAWRERHESYQSQGIIDVWLFGHHGVGRERHLRQSRARSWENPEAVLGLVDLSPLHRAIAAAGLPVLWISPIEEQIGTAVIDGTRLGQVGKHQGWHRHPYLVGPRAPGEDDQRAELRIDSLWNCLLDPQTGLVTPAGHDVTEQRRLVEAEAARLAVEEQEARERHRQREALRREREAAERAAAEAAKERQREYAEARATKAREAERKRRVEWRASPQYAALLAAVPADRTSVVLDGDEWYRGVYCNAERLRTAIYMSRVHQQVGGTFRFFDAVNTVTALPGFQTSSDRAIWEPVRDYLWHLHRNGLIDWPNSTSRFIPSDVDISVVADLTPAPVQRCQWCQFPVSSDSHSAACEPPSHIVDESQPPRPAANPYRYQQLPDWHADIGMLDQYAPGLRPIYGWHVEVFRTHVHRDVTYPLVPREIRRMFDPRWVTEQDLAALFDHFAATGWLRRGPTPYGSIWVRVKPPPPASLPHKSTGSAAEINQLIFTTDDGQALQPEHAEPER